MKGYCLAVFVLVGLFASDLAGRRVSALPGGPKGLHESRVLRGSVGVGRLEVLDRETVTERAGLNCRQLVKDHRSAPGIGLLPDGGVISFCPSLGGTPRFRGDQSAVSGRVSRAPLYPLAETFRLHSRLGAAVTLYLDFNGHRSSGTRWNEFYGVIDSAPFDLDGLPGSFSVTELEFIQRIWFRVVQQFAPFRVNVTTEEPQLDSLRRSFDGDTSYGVRVVVSPTSAWFPGAQGAAIIDAMTEFNANGPDDPAFVFPDRADYNEALIANSVSHEVGHTFGLYHHTTTSLPHGYYGGHGDWRPIMGTGHRPIVQWSHGEFKDALLPNQDDAETIRLRSFGAVQDHVGDSRWTAASIDFLGLKPSITGEITTAADRDVYQFRTGAGRVKIRVETASFGPTLDLWSAVEDSNGNRVAVSNPAGVAACTFDLYLPEGIYYVVVDGVGDLDPRTTGYSDYGSLGTFVLTASLAPISPSISGVVARSGVGLPGVPVRAVASIGSLPSIAPTVVPDLNIPDNRTSGVGSTMSVRTAGQLGGPFQVRVRVSHPEPKQLRLELQGPGGKVATLRDRTSAPTSGTYTVTGFEGQPRGGVWRLVARDLVGGKTGVLNEWQLHLPSVDGPSREVQTDAGGTFVFRDVPSDTYRIIPQGTFTPSSRTVTVANAPVTALSFSAP